MISTRSLSTININRILRTLWEREPISRIEIARLLELSKSTVTLIMPQLLERGIVVEKELRQAAAVGGRRPVGLGVNPAYGAVIGVEFQADFARVVALSLDGTIIFRDREVLAFDSTDLSSQLERTIVRAQRRLRGEGWRVIGAGLGVGGIVDPFARTLRRSNPLAIDSPVVIDASMDERLGIPVFIENDARCCCWGDMVSSRADGRDHFMYVLGELRQLTVEDRDVSGLAIGMAFVVDGKVHYGANFTSGEFSSVFIGHRDGERAVLNQTSVGIATLHDEGGRARVFEELASNVALVTNLMNLRSIGIAGDVVRYRAELTPVIREAIRSNWSYPNQSDVAITYTPFGEWAVAYGAAAFFIEQLFALPKVNEDQSQALPFGIDLFDLVDSFTPSM